MKTRREFMGEAAMLAAAAAIGPGTRKIHRPVDFHVDFFGPYTLNSVLSSDEKEDSFEIRIPGNAHIPDIFVWFKLSEIRRSTVQRGISEMTVVDGLGKGSTGKAHVYPEEGNLVFLIQRPSDPAGTRFWLALEDVKWVL